MASNCEEPVLSFKRGDDLKLDFTVQDTNNTVSQAAYAELTASQAALVVAEEADPIVAQDVIDATALVATNQATYDAAIIVDITGWTMNSQVRRAGKLVDTLDITILDAAAGTFAVFKDDLETVNWPVAKLDCDIQFTRPTGKVSSETFIINVQRDVTL